ncbi:MAG: purine-nucleoside phosphorylase [Myxococcota bacterium]
MQSEELYQRAAQQLKGAFGDPPRGAILLGSGGGPVAARWPGRTEARPYTDLGLPGPTVAGHAGRARLVDVQGQPVLVLSGRVHPYEGHSNEVMLRTIRALAAWGVERVMLMSAVGSLRLDLPPGALIQIVDHINFAPNPLVGNGAPLGARFPDLADAYTPRLTALIQDSARRRGIDLPQGVYAMMTGPSYETRAEAKMLRILGADVAGMSMTYEVIAAAQAGLEVLGVAAVSNYAAGLSDEALTHEEVLEVVGKGVKALGDLFEDVIDRW